MNYELAKRLKEAGFPQEFKPGDFGICGIEEGCRDVHGWIDFDFKESDMYDGSGEYGCGDSNDGFIISPTLSKLIDACGDRFASLNLGIDKKFHAWATRTDTTKYIDEIYGEGTTPEEAVANLWLKLNEEGLKK
jgi:hypothetical protein